MKGEGNYESIDQKKGCQCNNGTDDGCNTCTA